MTKSDEIINKWVLENKKNFLKRVEKYVSNGKEKEGKIKFTKNQIRAELISIIDKHPKIFTSKIKIYEIEKPDVNSKILADIKYTLL